MALLWTGRSRGRHAAKEKHAWGCLHFNVSSCCVINVLKKRIRSQTRAAELSFPPRAAGVEIRDRELGCQRGQPLLYAGWNDIPPASPGRGSGHVQLGGNPEEDPRHTRSPFWKASSTYSNLKTWTQDSKRVCQKLNMKYHTCREWFNYKLLWSWSANCPI